MANRILFVCTGNICRSPTAEGVFRKRFEAQGLQVQFDSAGTHAYHVGEAPDPRSIKAAGARKVDIAALRGRKVAKADFDQFDMVFALDNGHYQILKKLAKPEQQHKVQLLMQYAGHPFVTDVPDPYYGTHDDFEHVLNLLEWAANVIIARYETDTAPLR